MVKLQALQVQSPTPHFGLEQDVELLHQAHEQFERQYVYRQKLLLESQKREQPPGPGGTPGAPTEQLALHGQ